METIYLAHYGIKGQKWGERKYQNPDGSLTEAGRRRYLLNNKRTDRALEKAAKYREKSASNKLKAEKRAIKRDKITARPFQTDISIWRAKRQDRKRAKLSVRALKQDKKAAKLERKAQKWQQENKRITAKSISEINFDSTSEDFVRKNL